MFMALILWMYKKSDNLSHSVVSYFLQPNGYLLDSSVHGILQARILE